jgi:hypothetical protein
MGEIDEAELVSAGQEHLTAAPVPRGARTAPWGRNHAPFGMKLVKMRPDGYLWCSAGQFACRL